MHEDSLQQFDRFSLELHEENATLDSRFKLQSTQRTKAWEKFHTLRTDKPAPNYVGGVFEECRDSKQGYRSQKLATMVALLVAP